MAINKVIHHIHGPLFDISQDTVTAGVLMKGYTAHGANGELIEGTHNGGVKEVAEFPSENLDIDVIYKMYNSETDEYILYMYLNDEWKEFKKVSAGLYKTGTNYKTLITSWDELIESGRIIVDNGVVYCGKVLPDNLPEINEYGFYFDVPYGDDFGYEVVFHADGSVEFYYNGELDNSAPAGSAVYSTKCADMSSFDGNSSIATFTDEANMSWWDWPYSICKPDLTGDLLLLNDGSITALGDFNYDDGSGNAAFANCKGLTGIVIPNTVATITSGAFQGCLNITEIKIPISVTSIGGMAFHTDNDEGPILNALYYDGILEDWLKISLGHFSEYSTCGNIGMLETDIYFNGEKQTNVVIPDGITEINNCAFSGTTITSIAISDSVTNIGQYACSSCPITSVTFGENSSLTNIGMGAFNYTDISEIVIPAKVANIGSYTFENCENLVNITILNETPPSLEDPNALAGCSSLTAIKVPASSVDAYKAAYGWSEYTDIIVAIA